MQIQGQLYYTPADAAAYLKVKEATIKDYCRARSAGKVPVVAKKFGPRQEWRIKGSSLLRIAKAWGREL